MFPGSPQYQAAAFRRGYLQTDPLVAGIVVKDQSCPLCQLAHLGENLASVLKDQPFSAKDRVSGNLGVR